MTNANATSALLGVRVCEWARKWAGRVDSIRHETLTQSQPCSSCGRWMQAGERVIAYPHRAANAVYFDRWVYMHRSCEGEQE